MTAPRTPHLRVCIPARNEQSRIGSTLASIARAAEALPAARRERTSVTLALDTCTDDTAGIVDELARSFPVALRVTAGEFGSAAAARNAAVRRVTASAVQAGDGEWIAMTDADTVVPRGWLLGMLEAAEHDLVLGTVQPDERELEPRVLTAWRAMHELREGHEHVHGANLGFSRELFERLDGFAEVVDGEEVDFAERARALGASVLATDALRVTTSARLTGRAPLGFAGFLRDLR